MGFFGKHATPVPSRHGLPLRLPGASKTPMQYHLNGYRTGDPAIAAPADDIDASPEREAMHNEVDVLIHYVRRKFDRDIIRNVRGIGWTIPKAPR